MSKEKINFIPLKNKHLEFLNRTRNLVREYLHDNRQFTLDDTDLWFKRLKDTQKYYIIELSNFKWIGYFRLQTLFEGSKSRLVGADIHPECQGKGYGYKAWIKFMKKMKKDGVEHLELEVLGSNIRAYSLYRKLGFSPAAKDSVNEIKRGRGLIPSILMEKWL